MDYEKESTQKLHNKKYGYVYTGDPEEQMLDTFDRYIKNALKEQTREFYAKKVQEWMVMQVPDFLTTANSYLS